MDVSSGVINYCRYMLDVKRQRSSFFIHYFKYIFFGMVERAFFLVGIWEKLKNKKGNEMNNNGKQKRANK